MVGTAFLAVGTRRQSGNRVIVGTIFRKDGRTPNLYPATVVECLRPKNPTQSGLAPVDGWRPQKGGKNKHQDDEETQRKIEFFGPKTLPPEAFPPKYWRGRSSTHTTEKGAKSGEKRAACPNTSSKVHTGGT